MIDRDIVSKGFSDLLAGFGLLTRLPLPAFAHAAPKADAAWAWPVVGFAIAAAAALVAALGCELGLTPEIAAVLVLIAAALLTGGLHEDGLADCVDGFFGGRSKERRLEIMKDSMIGSYGALALGLILLLRWTALTAVIEGGHWGAILAAGALSRVPMVALMAGLDNARGSGLSASVGKPSAATAGAAAMTALVLALLAAGWVAIPMAFATLAVTLTVGAVARKKIGGQTGDVLGAAQQIAEAAALAITH